uniref:Uncharacterized protein n=1 Tax=Erythrocystis saccata TaxID=2822695 RepID=A0A8E6NSX9_9FLOR|nr:hypothetical protein [Erythrocystis saccata]
MTKSFKRINLCFSVLRYLLNVTMIKTLDCKIFLNYLQSAGVDVFFINITTSFFISLVLSLQLVKEFLYLNAGHLVSSILAISFIRELSPVLTSIIIICKVGSLFTSEIGTMVITEQIDALFILGINPICYLIYPRVLALILMFPILNLFSLFTSFFSSAFICFFLYNIDPHFFL